MFSNLLRNHNVGMKTFDLHELLLCVRGGYFCNLLCVRNVGIETFGLHVRILCDFEGLP